MQRALALVAIVAALSGCGTMSKNARAAVAMTGIGLSVGGVATYAEADPEPLSGYDAYGGPATALEGDRGQQLLGGLLVVTGLVVLIVGATADEPAPPPSADAAPAPLPSGLAMAPPGQATPGGALPPRPVVGEVQRLAHQAQRLAARHQCAAAATLVDRLAQTDAAYAAELRGTLVCVALPE